MRYRALDADGDYTFGQGEKNFLVNSSAMVGQSILTRLLLWEGEWFLDQTEGTPWLQSVMGKTNNPTYDLVIQQRILQTQGVKSIDAYSSSVGRTVSPRKLSVTVTVTTVYGEQITVST